MGRQAPEDSDLLKTLRSSKRAWDELVCIYPATGSDVLTNAEVWRGCLESQSKQLDCFFNFRLGNTDETSFQQIEKKAPQLVQRRSKLTNPGDGDIVTSCVRPSVV